MGASVAMGAGVIGSMARSPGARGELVAPGARVATGAPVGAGEFAGPGTGGAETTKSQSMSPPISYVSGTQQGQSTNGT